MSETSEFVPGGEKRGPGRPTNAEREAREQSLAGARAATEKQQRRRRSDSSETRNLKLAVPKDMLDPNFEYRWINDKASGRIHNKTVEDDWDIVTRVGDGKQEVPVTRNVGNGENGQPLMAYLCRKPKEFYEEDKGREQKAIKAREEDMRRGNPVSPEGLSGPSAYVPGGQTANRIGR